MPYGTEIEERKMQSKSPISPARGGWRAVILLALPALSLAGCATPQQVVAQKEGNLAAAGFMVRPADTPQREAMLQQLPPNHFVQRPHGDTMNYVYADPLDCNCLYVGTQTAYNQYKANMLTERLVNQQEMAGEFYPQPGWDWGAWGPWEPGFGWGPGQGW
jgi:hypothetical protein